MAAARISYRLRGLSWRVLIAATCAVLVMALLASIPVLAAARGDWCAERLSLARLAVLAAASESANASASAPERMLRRAGIEAIRVETPDRTRIVLAPRDEATLAGQPPLLAATSHYAFASTLAALLDAGPDEIELVTANDAELGGTLVVQVDAAALAGQLRHIALALAAGAVGSAIFAGLLCLLGLRLVLLRPLERLIGVIHGLRTGPDSVAPLSGVLVPPAIAFAAAALAAVRRDLRLAAWHEARLAAITVALAKLSHDQRGALSPALLAAERLQSSADTRVARAGDMLVRAVERAIELIAETVAFARTPQAAPQRVSAKLNAMVRAAAEQTTMAYPALTVKVDLDESIGVDADAAQLTLAFVQLFRTAASGGASSVTVNVEEGASGVVLLVTSDGRSLKDQAGEQLFKPPFDGSGEPGPLGLAIARDLLAANRGAIVLVSSDAGATTFRLTLHAG